MRLQDILWHYILNMDDISITYIINVCIYNKCELSYTMLAAQDTSHGKEVARAWRDVSYLFSHVNIKAAYSGRTVITYYWLGHLLGDSNATAMSNNISRYARTHVQTHTHTHMAHMEQEQLPYSQHQHTISGHLVSHVHSHAHTHTHPSHGYIACREAYSNPAIRRSYVGMKGSEHVTDIWSVILMGVCI